MKVLRILLAVWLSIAVPANALASVVNGHQCQAKQEAEKPAPMDHSAHAQHAGMAMDHAAMNDTSSDQEAQNGCACGCNCYQQHCVSGASGLAIGLTQALHLFAGADVHSVGAVVTLLAPAHHLDLIRPPSLI